MKKESGSIDWAGVHQRLQASEHALQAALHPDEKVSRAALERCAARLAQPRLEQSTRADAVMLLVFRLGGDRFGVALNEVVEVGELRRCTAVPGAAHELCGVFFHRGEVRSVIDLAMLLGRSTTSNNTVGGCFIHLRAGGKERRFRADALDEVLAITHADLMAPTSLQAGLAERYVKTMHRDGTVVLRGEALCGGAAAASSEDQQAQHTGDSL